MEQQEFNSQEQTFKNEEEEIKNFRELMRTRRGQLDFWRERVNDLRGGKQVIEFSCLDPQRSRGDRKVVADDEAVKILLDNPEGAKRFLEDYRRSFTERLSENPKIIEEALDLPLKNKDLGNPVSDNDINTAQAALLNYMAWHKAQLDALDRLEELLKEKSSKQDSE